MLQEKINADLKTAMKNQDDATKSLLRVIIGDFSRIGTPENDYGRSLSDEEILRLLKKFKEEAVLMNNSVEAEILDRYLPKMLSETELSEAIKEIVLEKGITDMKGMGIIMGELKKKFGSTYDGKMASQLVKEMF